MKPILILGAWLLVTPAAATECYEQKFSNGSSWSCDDGSRGYSHGDTVETQDPDDQQLTYERYGDRIYRSDGVVCTKEGSTWTCR